MITRHCDACKAPIEPDSYLELSGRILKTRGSEMQDAIEELAGDYCLGCICTGDAVADLLSGFTKYNTVQPQTTRRRKG